MIDSYAYTGAASPEYLIHPTTLDVVFQPTMLAYSAPGDKRLWFSVPTAIAIIRITSHVCGSLPTSGLKVPVHVTLDSDSGVLLSNIDLLGEDDEHGIAQVERMVMKPLAPATSRDDHVMSTETLFDVASIDATAIMDDLRPSAGEVELPTLYERLAYYYIKQWKSELSEAEWQSVEPHFAHLSSRINATISLASRGELSTVDKAWAGHDAEKIKSLTSDFSHVVEVKILSIIGKYLLSAICGSPTVFENLAPTGMLDEWSRDGLGFARYHELLARLVKQLNHRYAHARILDLGRGF